MDRPAIGGGEREVVVGRRCGVSSGGHMRPPHNGRRKHCSGSAPVDMPPTTCVGGTENDVIPTAGVGGTEKDGSSTSMGELPRKEVNGPCW